MSQDVKDAADKIIAKKYETLASQLGDLEFRKSRIQTQIKNILKEMEKLNDVQPVVSAALASIEYDNREVEEES